MSTVNITINGKKLQVEEGTTILEAAKLLDIFIPTLCHMNLQDGHVHNPGSCRVCVVEVEGFADHARGVVPDEPAVQNSNWTKGCIALLNHEMDELWDMVDPGTPIEIRP